MHYPVAMPEPITFSKVLKSTLIFALTLPLCAIAAVGLLYHLGRKHFSGFFH
jgi:hypothetical protein